MTLKTKKLDIINEEYKKCTARSLYERRTQIVFGKRSHDTWIVFNRETFGQTENEAGRVSIFLDKMIASLDLNRDDEFILNNYKCRPFMVPMEMDTCNNFLNEREVV